MIGSKSSVCSRLRSAVRASWERTPVALQVMTFGLAVVCGRGNAGDDVRRGAEIFAADWVPNNPPVRGGDGLGPVYNETSCLACHYQGGPGGAGPTSTNVEILTAIATRRNAPPPADLHPGFRVSRSIILHRFGVDPEYKYLRYKLLGEDHLVGMVESIESEIQQIHTRVVSESLKIQLLRGRLKNGLVYSERNPPPLFGIGLIDSLPDEILLSAEKRTFPGFPEIRGHARRLKDGRLGRFGWKAERPTLREFVLAACANELGLEVPGHHQAVSPLDPDAKAKGLDLTSEECNALVAYVKNLPAPISRNHVAQTTTRDTEAGRRLFESSGCATCHLPRIGSIDGIYSDMLLHDMGPALADSGSSYEIIESNSALAAVNPPSNDAGSQEWRTPPLWGFRYSGPYLHDGRAKNLDEAVAFHDEEGMASAKRFFKLRPEERLHVQMFLRSLAPPTSPAP